MKTTLRYTLMGLTLAGLTFLSTSCRKDLCYDHDEHGLSVKVNLSSDWEQEWERAYTYDWEELWEEDWKHDYDDLRPCSGRRNTRPSLYQRRTTYGEQPAR